MWKKYLIANHGGPTPSPSSMTVYSDASSPSSSAATVRGAGSESDTEAIIGALTGTGPASASSTGEELESDGAEGVWSPDIEQAFLEALAVYPPCGRRKIILSEEGKMFGRNELIARYIRLRTGKLRSRKQVSSHIQVLGRRQTKFISATSALISRKFAGVREKTNPYSFPLMTSLSPARLPFDTASSSPYSLTQAPDSSTISTPTKNLPNDYRLTMSTPDNTQGGGPCIPFQTLDQILMMSPSSHCGSPGLYSRQMSTGQPVFPEGIFSPMKGGPSRPTGCGLESTAYPVNPPMAHTYPTAQVPEIWSTSSIRKRLNMNPGESQTTEIDCLPADMTLPPSWQGRSVAGPKLRLVEMSAFIERKTFAEVHRHNFVHILDDWTYDCPLLETINIQHIQDKFPNRKGGLNDLYDRGPQAAFFLVKFWADMEVYLNDDIDSFYGTSNVFESSVNMTIQSSTKVCSFGRQVVEKVEKEFSTMECGRYVYRTQNSPMCDYLVNFLHKLAQLPEKSMMNSVLENFTALQLVTDLDTKETLLCVAFVFEVSTREGGPQHNIYRLTRD